MTRVGYHDTAALIRLARLCLDAGEDEAAGLAAEIATHRALSDPDAWLVRGMVRVKQKRLRDAREDFLRAALLAPTRIDSWCALAEACLELNSFTEATWALGKCVSLDPQMQSAHGTRARLLVVKARKRLAQRM